MWTTVMSATMMAVARHAAVAINSMATVDASVIQHALLKTVQFARATLMDVMSAILVMTC